MKACAAEFPGSFFLVNSFNLLSKWSNSAEKLITATFERAENSRPAILFFDKVDLLCPCTTDSAACRVKAEFLMQLQSVAKGSKNLIVVGATNSPWKLDETVCRRFEKRLYLAPPNKEERINHIKWSLNGMATSLTTDDYSTLGDMTERFTGEDIEVLVRHSLMEPVRKCQSATRFRVTDDGYFIPTAVSDPSGVEHTIYTVPDPSRVRTPIICKDDFVMGMKSVKNILTADTLKKFEDWNAKFGSEDN